MKTFENFELNLINMEYPKVGGPSLHYNEHDLNIVHKIKRG
jgi:hypothetical protein